MRYDYFAMNEKPPTLTATALVLLMLLALILSPSLAFANSLTSDSMPRYILSPEDISNKVAEELEKAGYGDMVEATVQVEDPSTVFGADEPITIGISGLDASSDSHKWSANVLFKGKDRVLTALPMSGRFDEMVKLPVLNRALASGEEITKEDISMQVFPAHYQRAGVIHTEDKLIGKAVKRNVSKDRPIREHEVSLPMIVKKNDLINLTYASNGLVITTTGQVMANASKDEVIQVKNINSEKVIRAVIKDAKTASVIPLNQTTSLMGNSHDYR